ncbi:putative midasin [Apostichopus japonicus]|uniref:Midasin n=1 Tax=Stichopus japonicus TaxID=307972 RepID=A0A2G8LKU3_STIJA|nr:putative midasin [Apostichopus japonicus]
METDYWDVTNVLEEAVEKYEPIRKSLGPFVTAEELSPQSRQDVLEILSQHLLDPELTEFVSESFSPLLLELVQRAVKRVSKETHGHRYEHDRLFVATGKHLLTNSYGVERSPLLNHLSSSPSPFQGHGLSSDVPPKKKRKSQKPKRATSDEDIVKAALKLVQHDRNLMSATVDWANFANFLSHDSKMVKWYTCQTLSLLNKLGESEKDIFLLQHFTQKEIQQLSLCTADVNGGNSTGGTKEVCTLTSLDASSGRKIIQTQDLSPNVVSISGVLLSMKQDKLSHGEKGVPSAHVIIPVQSTKTSLQNLALAIVSGSPVLLEGPVGSGKTSYVEHIANLTGRGNPCDLIKVQLGDQTDSKALVGTYRCTEIPGEFVWQPGPLTQAVQEGKWILLEDLDYAPMDVISVLLPLLESGSLTVPGHGDTIRAAPGFQIFATQRLYSHDSGLYRQQSAHSAVLDHCWTKIRVNSLSKNELYQVIVKLYPKLETVAGKLLEIFLLLCASYHEQEEEEGAVAMETNTELLEQTNWKQRGNRLVSTRDLLKWCDRVYQDQDFTTSQTANMVLLEALDCFTSCLPKPEMRLAAAQAIGALINISREQTQYFCQSYKPAIEVHPTSVRVGRITLRKKVQEIASLESGDRSNFSFTRHSLVLLERIAACIFRTEPVLLVGETGTGKTSTVQYLAKLAGQRLKVINMNQQSDSTDLLGGYKPVDIRRLVAPVREKFEQIFVKTFSRKQNLKFLGHIQKSFHGHQWQNLLKLMTHSTGAAVKKQKAIKNPSQEQQEISKEWKRVSEKLNKLKLQIKHAEGALAFTFVEGTLVRALHDGDWILLDEINLASAETLECLSSLLEGPNSSLMLMEKGDLQPVVRHPDFRLFACMNPATDIGKKELPMGIRNRFTEFYVDELVSPTDLQILICDYLKGFNLSAGRVQSIVSFYTSVRSLSKTKLMDGTGHHPHFSLRTLCRALSYAATNPCGIIPRSLYESFCLSFLTQLDKASCPMVRQLILKYIVGKTSVKGILGQPIPPPINGDFTKVEGYWIAQGQKEPCKPKGYILTQSVKGNLKMLARIVSARRFPVLLQGETSVGVLVDAMRKGYWIILDELNLAPSDVLEALNRELFIPETQEMVSAHPGFMLFATQNPPGQYGGRKILSRAFRNRFVELHFDEIPSRELETILHGRCAIPESYSQKMVSVMLELGLRRKGSGVFAGKQGFMTLRDLFRWAERYHQSSLGGDTFHDWDQHIADEGFLLLAGKVRRLEEREVVKEVLQQKLKRTVNDGNLFSLHQDTSLVTKPILEKVINTPTPKGFETSGLDRKPTSFSSSSRPSSQVRRASPAGWRNRDDNKKLLVVRWTPSLGYETGNPFLIDEISLADDSVLERLNSVLEPEQSCCWQRRQRGEPRRCGGGRRPRWIPHYSNHESWRRLWQERGTTQSFCILTSCKVKLMQLVAVAVLSLAKQSNFRLICFYTVA